MTVRIIGGGWYGSHICAALALSGLEVELHEAGERLFMGASGSNPARLHKGFHYPRSRLTRAACLEHADRFMASYGALTRAVPVNLYAVAAEDSWLDFGAYRDALRGDLEFITVEDPSEFGLEHVEGALLTGERHIVVDEARAHFELALGDRVHLGSRPERLDSRRYELTVDCTFCALDALAIDRYEPCVTAILEGPSERAVTIMDGPFPSIYPWNERHGLSSLTSASLTPLSKECRTYAQAQAMIATARRQHVDERCAMMLKQIGFYWPAAMDLYRIVGARLSVRAMPRSGADARLVDVVSVGERALRVRAGKIDAVFRAEALVREWLACSR